MKYIWGWSICHQIQILIQFNGKKDQLKYQDFIFNSFLLKHCFRFQCAIKGLKASWLFKHIYIYIYLHTYICVYIKNIWYMKLKFYSNHCKKKLEQEARVNLVPFYIKTCLSSPPSPTRALHCPGGGPESHERQCGGLQVYYTCLSGGLHHCCVLGERHCVNHPWR